MYHIYLSSTISIHNIVLFSNYNMYTHTHIYIYIYIYIYISIDINIQSLLVRE